MNYSKKLLNGEWNLQLVNFKSDLPKDKKGKIPIKELENEQSINVTVPGEVHMDLFKNKLIPDLYIGEKELEYRWIPESDWKYSREFKVCKKEINDSINIDLVCDGIDTVADIFINGVKLEQRAENMFRIYRFKDIKKYLKFGSDKNTTIENQDSGSSDSDGDDKQDNTDEFDMFTNKIEIVIYSPAKYCKDLAKSYKYPIPEWEYPNGIPHRNFIRKCACHFSWDWSCCFCPMGIWKNISLEFYSTPLFKEVIIHQNHSDYHVLGTVEIEIAFKLYTSSITTLKSTNIIDDGLVVQVLVKSCNSENGENVDNDNVVCSKQFSLSKEQLLSNLKQSLKLVINNAKLWWPLGHGEQNLYNVEISIPNSNNNGKLGGEIFKINKKIGLRTATVDVSKDIHGRRFQMVVNSVPIFAKGADWIPADHFLTRITNDKIFHLLNSARLANMNCLRLWGGGVYENDYFYELCDKFGILIWNDLMFGCALYPTNKEFLKNVKKEIKCQINRIGHHACIILWCGSNESEQAIVEKVWDPIKENSHRYTIDFNTLYVDVIMKILRKKLPESFYWVSSPSNGVHEWGDPNDQTKGDTHYWGVWHGGEDIRTGYLKSKSRFLSEFGFQSLPSFTELEKVLSADQLNITSPEMEGRQRSPNPGNIGILKHIGVHFRVPLDFKLLCYTSQMLQAYAIKLGCEHYRRMKPYCMGTLYWQLNDVWVGPSWSSIEYNGNWKPLQYFAKKFYQPILLSFAENLEDPNVVEVWITHDYDGLENTYLQSKIFIWVWDLSQSSVVYSLETIVSIVLSDKGQLSKRVFQTTRDKLFGSLPLPSNNYIVTAHLDCSTNGLKSNNQQLCTKFSNENYKDISNTFYPVPFKKLNLKPTKIQIVKQPHTHILEGNYNDVVSNIIDTAATSDRSGIVSSSSGISGIIVNKVSKCFEFTLESTDSIALMVWIECSNYSTGYYSDNGFNLLKGHPKTITYYPNEFNPTILPIFNFTSLRDTY